MTLLLPFLLSAAPMTFDELINPAWKAMATPKTTVFWNVRVAPALPSEWPMTKTSTVVRWVYAAGRDLDLRDGERVAGPWARIDLPTEGTPTLSRLSSSLELVGTQGVRPISKAEAEAVKPAVRRRGGAARERRGRHPQRLLRLAVDERRHREATRAEARGVLRGAGLRPTLSGQTRKRRISPRSTSAC